MFSLLDNFSVNMIVDIMIENLRKPGTFHLLYDVRNYATIVLFIIKVNKLGPKI